MPASIPDKKYFKIGEVSRICGLEPHVLRFWEKEFAVINPKKDGGNQRLYQKKDIESILEIKKLLYDKKFTIAGAKEKLKETASAGESDSISSDDKVLREKLADVKRELEEIRDLLSQ